MCGIAGVVSREALDSTEEHFGSKMLQGIRHRGPDGLKSWLSPNRRCWLGHARLSVIDLEQGWQPMLDEASGAALVYNGEIYNYRELKIELASAGEIFRTQSDSEVLLRGLLRYGEKFLPKLRGIFSFALYLPRENAVLFGRDPLGVKPLYYSSNNGVLRFCSELRPLAFEPSLNEEAVIEYLAMGYALAPKTMLGGVFQLNPGSFAWWRNGKWSEYRYFDVRELLQSKNRFKGSYADAQEELGRLTRQVIQSQMVADIPVGVALSGGIDSSLVAALSAGCAGQGLQMFTVDFAEAGYSELDAARKVTQLLDARHQIFDFSFSKLSLVEIEDMFWKSDAPIFDNSFFPSHFLYKNVKQHCSVLLAGDGGDELFLGYETHRADAIAQRFVSKMRYLQKPIQELTRKFVPVRHGKVTASYKLRAFADKAWRKSGESHCGWRELLADEGAVAILRPDKRNAWEEFHPRRKFQKIFDSFPAETDLLTRMSALDLETWLANDILVKTDRASMASGVEVRVPLLDDTLVKFALSLPDKMKFQLTQSKRILRETLQKELPGYPVGPKRGFNAPSGEWLKKQFESKFKLISDNSALSSYVRGDVLEEMTRDHREGTADYGFFFWALMSLDCWWRGISK